MRPIYWGIILFTVAGASTIYAAFSHPPNLVASAFFGVVWFLSLPAAEVAELIQWINRRRKPAVAVLSKSLVERPKPTQFSSIKTGTNPKNVFGGAIKTLRGEIVRSKAERIIADYLYYNNIDYRYEKPAASSEFVSRTISRPDFYLPTQNVFVEFWGLLDAEDESTRLRYERDMEWKMSQYSRNGIRVISLFPKDLDDLDKAFKSKVNQVTNAQS